MPGSSHIGNFFFGFSILRLHDFLYDVFHLQGKMAKMKWKIYKLLHNILVTSSPKTTKIEVTKMDANVGIWDMLLDDYGRVVEQVLMDKRSAEA